MTDLEVWTEVYVACVKGCLARGEYEGCEVRHAKEVADRAVETLKDKKGRILDVNPWSGKPHVPGADFGEERDSE